ncbi:Gldg family protein [Pseudobacter ginsenosidimutans]|jgi:ABC-2 type transport system permease protein|uniref:ABC-2 type transport system permease protein n=1 Tax=Pseudobacter ginsenosidimutans TaxID=661488 RepID=A0A4Q7MZY8_9BACT|nr:Gldg family protein [Pseudobacter ginsenosidimutans]QEC43484.1 ABC transporter permease subunit [Pseudobacter ginsenosidimutans]RZS74870.1 ABC-2 type transport system permease protein [Pseudobacter ginsenosidimutans]
MKLILKVARTELRNLFYSPVAWFLTIAFMAQCALFYTIMVEKMARFQELFVKNNSEWIGFNDSLTQTIFLADQGIFVNVLQNLFLFVPLLTMGLISREINNGTIKLLYSSPLKIRHIVLGKYLATMAYNVLLVGIVGVFVILGMTNIEYVDYGRLLTSLLGFFMLVCAYTAIGIFMSSVTTYQIISAIATFTIIFFLSYIGELWQKYDYIRDITHFLSMKGRAIKLLSGLIRTTDIIYFATIIVMFLGFTLFRLKGAREFVPTYKKSIRYVSLIVVCLAVGYITSRPGLIGYWDTTRDNINTIHPKTQAILAGFEKNEPVEITLYANMLGRNWMQGGMPERRMDYMWRLWEPYLRFKPDLKFKFVTYYDIPDNDSTLYKAFPGKTKKQIAEEIGKGIGGDVSKCMPPEEVRKMIDLTPEGMQLVLQAKYKGRATFIRTYVDGVTWPNETNVSAAFLRLQQDTMPKVLFTSGNLERSIFKSGEREYAGGVTDISKRASLVNIGFDNDTINLDQQDIPKGISSLVIADPKTALSPVKQDKIRKYIAGGGNVFILTEPGKTDLVNPLLAETGTEFMPGTIVEISKNEAPNMALPFVTKDIEKMAPDAIQKLRLKIKNERKTPKRRHVKMLGTTAIRQLPGSSFSKYSFLQTNSQNDIWIKMGHLVADSTAPVFSPQEGDFRDSSFSLMGGIYRNINGKEQRIMLSGDADFFSNRRSNGDDMLLFGFSWLDNNRFPNFAVRPSPMDLNIKISSETANMQVWVFLYILPAIVLLLGIVLLVRRKRK